MISVVIQDRWEAEAHRKGKGLRWRVRWTDETNKGRSKSFAKKGDAEKYAHKIKHDLLTGVYRDPRSGEMTFGEYATNWQANRHDAKPATKELQEGWLRNHLNPAFGDIPLNRLTIEHGHKYLNDDQRSSYLHKKTMMHCRKILNDAVAERLVPSNPFATLRLPKEGPKKEISILNILELEELILATAPKFQTLIKVAGYMALRQGEIFGLHPKNVDLDRGVIHVVEALDSHVEPPRRSEVKTKGSRRTLQIPNFLIGDLEEQLLLRSSEDYVFPSKRGGYLRKNNFMRDVYRPALKEIGREGFRFHDLRHTAISMAINSKADIKAIQHLAGHSDIRLTLDTYGHLLPSASAEVADAMDSLRAVVLNEGPAVIDLTAFMSS